MKALIVDDSKVVRSVISNILADLGINYDEAENGNWALERVSQESYKFIILDWNMPEKDGITFFSEAKEKGLLEDTQVIFCTTENEVEKITEAINLGANEYIMKPFNKEILEEKLQILGVI